jgi:hypothetical protein
MTHSCACCATLNRGPVNPELRQVNRAERHCRRPIMLSHCSMIPTRWSACRALEASGRHDQPGQADRQGIVRGLYLWRGAQHDVRFDAEQEAGAVAHVRKYAHRRTSRAGSPAASPTLAPPGSCTPRQGAAIVHRSFSPSTRTSTATPGTPSRCSGFAESTRCLECSAPASTEASTCASGPQPMASSGIRARPAAGGPGRPEPGLGIRSTPPPFSTSAW